MSQLKEERGYAALIAILVVLILTIIGTNLLHVVMTSLIHVRKTETRGEAEYFARMGMNEALTRLSFAIDEVNSNITPSSSIQDAYTAHYQNNTFNRHVDNVFHTVTAPDPQNRVWRTTTSPIPVATSGINGNYQIYYLREVRQEFVQNRPFVEKFTIRVVGRSTSTIQETRTLETTVYVNTFPDEFHYVLSTPGNIYLNGSSYVDGDTYASRYYMRNSANYFLNEIEYGRDTTYPSIVGQLYVPYKGVTDAEDLLKHARFFKTSSDTPFEPKVKDLNNDWYKVFVLTPTLNLSAGTKTFSSIPDIGTTVLTKGSSFTLNSNQELINDGAVGETKLEGSYPTPSSGHNAVLVDDSAIIEAGKTATFTTGTKIQGSFEMEDQTSLHPTLSISGGNLYITGENGSTHAAATLRGTVTLANDSTEERYIYIDGDAVFENLTFDGKIYVNGNLTIQGNFNMNATIYVNGKVDFTEEDASNPDENTNKTLVILAKGTVEAYNLNLYSNKTKNLNTFIYSQDKDDLSTTPPYESAGIVLYGIGSNMTFIGGIYSEKSITLNAVREQVTSSTNLSTGEISLNFGTPESDPRKSRLRILFNKSLYENPPEGLPTANRFNLKISQIELDVFPATALP